MLRRYRIKANDYEQVLKWVQDQPEQGGFADDEEEEQAGDADDYEQDRFYLGRGILGGGSRPGLCSSLLPFGTALATRRLGLALRAGCVLALGLRRLVGWAGLICRQQGAR